LKRLIKYFLFIQSLSLWGQDYDFHTFGKEEGISQTYIYDLVQSSKGFLYAATGDGLSVFDGFGFQVFRTEDGLAENFCTTIFIDSRQRKWIGHLEGGITLIDSTGIKRITGKEESASKIVSFSEDEHGVVYCASADGWIYCFKGRTKAKVNMFRFTTINKMSIKGNLMFIASTQGLLSFNIYPVFSLRQTFGDSKDENITALAIDEKSGILAGVDGKGLFEYEATNNYYFLKRKYSGELKSKYLGIKDICLGPNKEVFLSLNGEGIRQYSRKNDTASIDVNVIDGSNGLRSLYISKIYYDRDGDYWFATVGSGLLQFISRKFELYDKRNYLANMEVKSLCVDDANSIFISDGKKIGVFFRGENKLTEVLSLFDQISESEIRELNFDNKNKGLMVSTNVGLLYYQFVKGKLINKKLIEPFKDKIINSIVKKKESGYFICTTSGLYETDPGLKVLKIYDTDNGLPHNNVISCMLDSKERLWVFSPETPLYNIWEDSVTIFKDIDSLNSFRFTSGIELNEREIWFGTEGEGVYLYRNNTFKKWNTHHGLLTDFVYNLAVTEKKDLIALHKDGISIRYKNTKNFKPISKSGGLLVLDVLSINQLPDREGRIWIGCKEGLLCYNPSMDKINKHPPEVSITDIRFNDFRMSLKDSVHRLQYGTYEMSVDFIGISLTDPKAVQYRYRLIGVDFKWQYSNVNTKVYPNLSDGKYTFEVYATNSAGYESAEPERFSFEIASPIWKKPWFYVLLITALVLIVYLIFNWRLKALNSAKLQLEKMVEEQTLELKEEKEKVEETNLMLELKNSDITASIEYAKKIQGALMIPTDEIPKALDLFILFKPRDIVSGDFYWYHETEQSYYVAAVDCTGHGVPGAFMSILGSTFLDQIMVEHPEASPSAILYHLDAKILHVFRKKGEKMMDGMDLSICVVSKKERKVTVSTANRPIYYFSKGEITEIRSNAFSIGAYFGTKEKSFTDTVLSLDECQSIYLSTDGFADQFGGEKVKRYSTKKFKDLLVEIQEKSALDQMQSLDEDVEKWKGKTEQIDDILVIGIKFT